MTHLIIKHSSYIHIQQRVDYYVGQVMHTAQLHLSFDCGIRPQCKIRSFGDVTRWRYIVRYYLGGRGLLLDKTVPVTITFQTPYFSVLFAVPDNATN